MRMQKEKKGNKTKRIISSVLISPIKKRKIRLRQMITEKQTRSFQLKLIHFEDIDQ